MIKTAHLSLVILSALLLHLGSAVAQAATLSFSPTSGSANRGCSLAVNVLVDTRNNPNNQGETGQETDGTDAIIKYDPTIFTIAVSGIQNGTIYQDYPGNSVDAQNGQITISGLASVNSAYRTAAGAQAGVFATLNLTVKADAPLRASDLTFDFDPADPAKTVDSNIVKRGDVIDILTAVNNAKYTVGSGACGSQGQVAPVVAPGAPVTKTGVTTTPGKGGVIATDSAEEFLKKTPLGDSTTTWVLTVIGSALTIVGILGLAML